MNILRTIPGLSTKVLIELEKQFGNKYFYNFNSFRHSTLWAFESYKKSLECNKDILCVETPLIGRQLYNNEDPKSYYRIGLNNVSSFFYKNFFIPIKPDYQRIEDILNKTNTILKPWRIDGSHIIYAMQVPGDTSLLGLDIFCAAQYDLVFLKKISKRPIIISMHPDLKKKWGKKEFKRHDHFYQDFLKIVEMTKSTIYDGETNDLLDDAWCTVCHTSGMGFESIVNGIPAITLSERSFVRPLTSSSYYDIESLLMPERMDWFSKIAYTQWTLDEVKTGIFKDHVENIHK